MIGTFGRRWSAGLLACCVYVCAAYSSASAQSVAEFYKGKSVTLVVGIAPGGGYDLSARMVARHIGRYIPGSPNVVVQNMPGVNSVLAANYVYGIAPRDGTVLWTGSRTTPYEPLMGNQAAKFQPAKVHWVGSTSSEIGVILAWHTAPHQTAEDLFKREMIVGATDPGAENSLFPLAFNNLLGTKFQIVRGYANQGAITLAMERGEVQGDANTAWSNLPTTHGDWLKDTKIRLLMQSSLDRHPDLPNLPSALEFAKTYEERQILKILLSMKTFGYPFFVAPEVPSDHVKALQAAFAATMKDSAFLADITQLLRKISPASGAEMDELISAAYAQPADVIQKTRKALTAAN
jgi:tripartite-type tricarboxylate transporter receptor subunit TctC